VPWAYNPFTATLDRTSPGDVWAYNPFTGKLDRTAPGGSWAYNPLTGRFDRIAPSGGGSDADALAYIAAVEAADGQTLETGVKDAINTFVIGCKADGIWDAIKASCILAGARTLAGALVPLKGAAPTNFNFVTGDYNRKTGLVGDGTAKYLNSNRAGNLDPQNNAHSCVYITTEGLRTFMANTSGAVTGQTYLDRSTNIRSSSQTSTLTATVLSALTGLLGISRSGSASYTLRSLGANSTITQASQTPNSQNILFYARDASSPGSFATHRMAFYSIGESLDLALLDTRLTTLINAYTAVIP
jgi:hypothetical protein